MATTSTSSATGSSGLDVAGIVSQMMTIEKRPLTALATKEAGIQAKLSALGTVKSALGSFQGALPSLSDITQFQGVTAASSDSTMLTASALSTATAGSYTLSVSSLAQAQQLVATGQISQTTAIGTGASTTLTFDFGTVSGGTFAGGKYTGATFTSNGGGTKTVTIDSTNNSLQGIRDAINAANIGVTASIINDGSGTPYRLTLSSNSQGANNSIKISVAGDATISSLLAQDPANNTGQALSETSTAQNANFTVNGVAVSKSSNTVTDAIHGVTLNLLQKTTTPVTLTVAKNTSSISTTLSNFVKAYNDLHKAIAGVSSYDPATKTGGILQGDFAVNSVINQIIRVMNTPVSTSGALTTMSQVGISFQKDGTLSLDTTKLNSAIASNPNDIAALFATVGSATDSLISYSSAASTVQPGNYAVNVTQLATQGSIVGSAVAGTTITAGVNDTLNMTVDGHTAPVTLTAGTYTAASLASAVQAAINGANGISGAATVSVSQTGGIFTIISGSFGSASAVAISGNGASNLLGGAPVSTTGVDVAGTIGGQAATGAGQFLTSGNGNSLGLKIQITGGSLGARGTVNYSKGYGDALTSLTTTLLGTNGLLDSETTGLNQSITDIGKQRDALNARLVQIQASYTKQFSALDVMLTSMNNTQTYLTQQLANLPKA